MKIEKNIESFSVEVINKNYKNAVDDLRVCMLKFFPDVSTLPSLVAINLVKVDISSCHLA